MLIKIINGTYGHRPVLPNGNFSPFVVPVDRNDPPIEVDDKKAAELIAGGIAKAVEAAKEEPKAEEPAQNEPVPEETEPVEVPTEKPEAKPQTKAKSKKAAKAEDAPVLTTEDVVE